MIHQILQSIAAVTVTGVKSAACCQSDDIITVEKTFIDEIMGSIPIKAAKTLKLVMSVDERIINIV